MATVKSHLLQWWVVAGGTLIKLVSAVHKVATYYYHGPKRSSNKIRILQTKFEIRIWNKTNLTSLIIII